MLFLPPNFKTIFTVVVGQYYFEYYRVFLVIKDKDGNIIGEYEFNQIPYTTVGYTEATTPAEEGLYILEYWVYRKDGTPYFSFREVPLIISEKGSLLGLLHYLFNNVEKYVFRRLDNLCNRFESMCNYVENVLLVDAIDTRNATRDSILVLEEHILPMVNETKSYAEDINSKIEELAIPNLNTVKNVLQKFLKWLKKRNA